MADTVMGHLPPVGWADVATKQDLTALEGRLEARIEVLLHQVTSLLHREIGVIRREMINQTKWFMGATIGAVIAVSDLPQVLGAVFPGG